MHWSYEKYLAVLGGGACKYVMCRSSFSEKNLLSVFPSFQGRVPGAGKKKKKLDIHRGLQILAAGCDLAEPHINSSMHIYVLTGRN